MFNQNIWIDLYGLANFFKISDLFYEMVSFFKNILSIDNVSSIYKIARRFGPSSLEVICIVFIDKNANVLLREEKLISLDKESLVSVISRDTFCAPEIDILNMVESWHTSQNYTNGEAFEKDILKEIRLSLFNLKELANISAQHDWMDKNKIYEEMNSQLLSTNYRNKVRKAVNEINTFQWRNYSNNKSKSKIYSAEIEELKLKIKESTFIKDQEIAELQVAKAHLRSELTSITYNYTRKNKENVELQAKIAKAQLSLAGHISYITSLQLLGNNKLASGSSDNTIQIWNITSGECDLILAGHRTLRSIGNNKLASVSLDNKLQIWNIDSAECVRTLVGGSICASNLQLLGNNKLASLTQDHSIQIWNIDSGECIRTLFGHTNHVESLESIGDNKLASLSSDKTLKIWNIESSVCVQTFTFITYVYKLQSIGNNKIASGMADFSIQIWNIDSGECVRKLTGHKNYIYSFQSLVDNKLASGSGDNIIKIWNIGSGECVQTLIGHTNIAFFLQSVDNNKLASGSADNTIKIWNIESGECIRTLARTSYVYSFRSI